MITKAELHSVRALRHRATRETEGLFVVEGWKGIMELLASTVDVVRIYARSEVQPPSGHFLPDAAVPVTAKEMERMSQMKTPPGILATARIPDPGPAPRDFEHLATSRIPLLLYCDGIADPGNLGTLIRTADWFGFAGVVCDRTGVDPWNAKCLQASMGSAMRMRIWTVDGADWLRQWKSPVWALDAHGSDLCQTKWQPGALVIGSESHGLSAESRERATETLAIPGAGQTESLNAAIAGSIAMFEIARSVQAF